MEALSVRGAHGEGPSVNDVATSAGTLSVRTAATGASTPNVMVGTGSSVCAKGRFSTPEPTPGKGGTTAFELNPSKSEELPTSLTILLLHPSAVATGTVTVVGIYVGSFKVGTAAKDPAATSSLSLFSGDASHVPGGDGRFDITAAPESMLCMRAS